jgi:hypothetical protein
MGFGGGKLTSKKFADVKKQAQAPQWAMGMRLQPCGLLMRFASA